MFGFTDANTYWHASKKKGLRFLKLLASIKNNKAHFFLNILLTDNSGLNTINLIAVINYIQELVKKMVSIEAIKNYENCQQEMLHD